MTRASRDSLSAPAQLEDLADEAQRNPKSFPAQLSLGDAYYDRQMHAEAILSYKKALQLRDSTTPEETSESPFTSAASMRR